MRIQRDTATQLARFLEGSITSEELECWIVSLDDADVVSPEEESRLQTLRLLLLEAGEGLRPLDDAKNEAAFLLAGSVSPTT